MNSSSFYFHLFIFATFILLSCLNPTGATTCHPEDKAGLLVFKKGITEDPTGILNSWKENIDCCSWDGVTCTNHGRVAELAFMEYDDANIYLSGTISPSLSKLKHLEGFGLGSLKNITGPFPQFLFKLPHLRYIYLQNNRLSGPLPSNIGSLSPLLDSFSINRNRFTGRIPDSISNLTRLNYLNLGENLLTGKIPLGIANLKLMANLYLQGNHLSGAIPNIFKTMTKMIDLDLSRNRFSGKLPPSMASVAPTLVNLWLSQNNISGSIPNYISRFKSLLTLDLSMNQFSGVVPKSVGDLTNIIRIDLSHNHLCGKLPVTKFPKSVFVGNDCLCGSPLAPCRV